MERIHVVLTRAEKERFRRLAVRAGKSLSEWLRDAAREKMASQAVRAALDSEEALDEFFAECDAGEAGQEPDWEEHKRVISGSVGAGGADS